MSAANSIAAKIVFMHSLLEKLIASAEYTYKVSQRAEKLRGTIKEMKKNRSKEELARSRDYGEAESNLKMLQRNLTESLHNFDRAR